MKKMWYIDTDIYIYKAEINEKRVSIKSKVCMGQLKNSLLFIFILLPIVFYDIELKDGLAAHLAKELCTAVT